MEANFSLANVARQQGDAIGSLRKLYFAPVETVLHVADPVNRIVASVILASRQSWYRIEFVPGTARFTDKPAESAQGNYSKLRVIGTLANCTPALELIFDNMKGRHYLLLGEDHTDQWILFGDKENPLEFSKSFDSGQLSGRPDYDFEFNGQHPKGFAFFSGTYRVSDLILQASATPPVLSSPPPAPAPVAAVTVVDNVLSSSATSALSANQGRILNDLIALLFAQEITIEDVTDLVAALAEKASIEYVQEQIALLVDSSPGALNTLQELAHALGDDPNFATTVATQIGAKLDKVADKATQAEVEAGTNDTHWISSLRLASWWTFIWAYVKGQAQTFTESLTAKTLSVSGTAGAGYFGMIPQSADPATPTSGWRLFSDATGRLAWKGSNGFRRIFDGLGITADRIYTLPDKTGTVALSEYLPSRVGAVIDTVSFTNSSAENTLASITIPANQIQTGDRYQLILIADRLNNTGGAFSIPIRVYFGGVLMFTVSNSISSSANRGFYNMVLDVIQTTSSGQRLGLQLSSTAGSSASSAVVAVDSIGTTTATAVTSGTIEVKVTAQMPSASSLADIRLQSAVLMRYPA